MVSHVQVSAHQGRASVFMEGKIMLEGNSKLRAHDFLLAESLPGKKSFFLFGSVVVNRTYELVSQLY